MADSPSGDDQQPDAPFEPELNTPEVDAATREAREEWDRDLDEVNSGWRTHAEPRLQACQDVIDQLARFHSEVVDRTDIDLSAETRWVAILESTSRCISIADALIDQLRRGYASETAGTARMLHEGLDLAVALAGGDEELAKRWLRGKHYPTKRAKQERTAYFARLVPEDHRATEFEEAVAPHVADLESELGRQVAGAEAIAIYSARLYGELSVGAHNVRRGFADGISMSLRRFTYGRHPAVGVRSTWIEIGEGLVEQTCLDVSACLAEMVGVDAVREATLALIGHLQAVRTKYDFH